MSYSIKLRLFCKKNLCRVMILLLLLGMWSYPATAAGTDGSYKSASVVFGEASDVSTNMSWLAASDNNTYERVKKDGKYGVVREPENDRMYLCFFVSDNTLYSNEPMDVAVTVEYYDEGNGKFSLRYNSENDGLWATPRNETDWDIVEMTGTGEWKSHTFYLEDCLLNNGLMYSSDIEIGLWTSEMGKSTDSIVFGSFKIEEVYPRKPVKTKFMSEHFAYIYGENDAEKINIVLENKANDSFETNVSYIVTDYNGETVTTGSYTAEVEALGVNTTTVNTGAKKFGIYDISVNTSSVCRESGEEYTNTETVRIAKALTTESGDKKNNYMKICTHLHSYDQESAVEQVARGGFSGIRQEYFYATALSEGARVGAENGLALNAEMKERIELVKENNLEMLQILAYDSDGGDVTLPETTAEIEGFAKYCAFMAKELLGVTNKFEVWNEPNHENFSGDGQSASDYVKVLKAAYKAITDVNPDAIIYAGAIASAESTSYLHQMMWAGAANYCHGISVHPYTWYPMDAFDHQERIETINKFKNVLKLYSVDKPVIFSEIGWTTSECDSGVSEIEQAIYAIQLPTLSMAHNLADEIYWYTLKETGSSETETNDGFGITEYYKGHNANAAKPAYVALAAYNKFMAGDISYIGSNETEDLSRAVHIFENEAGKRAAIIWTTNSAAEDAEVNLGHCKSSLYDMYGNNLGTLYSDNGIYTISATAEPQYLISNYDIAPSAIGAMSTSVNRSTREVTIEGEISDRNIEERLTILAVPGGVEPNNNPEAIIYINEIEVNAESFAHTFKIPSSSNAEWYDVYLCGNYVSEMQTSSIAYLAMKVASVSLTDENTQLSAVADTSNHTGEDKNMVMMIAQYNGDTLVKVDVENKTVTNNSSNSAITMTAEKVKTATHYKAFVVDSLDNMRPLCETREI